MNDLLYLIAHAPAEPWDGFEPEMPPQPQAPTPRRWIGPDYAKTPEYSMYSKECEDYRFELHKWDTTRKRERLIQWPLFWAKTMRNQVHPPQTGPGLADAHKSYSPQEKFDLDESGQYEIMWRTVSLGNEKRYLIESYRRLDPPGPTMYSIRDPLFEMMLRSTP